MTVDVSVLMSVYYEDNYLYLYESLNSLQKQTYKPKEVVIVRDGKVKKEIEDVIEKYRDDLNIKNIYLYENKGLACALNEGMLHCESEIIARMDPDDISFSIRFEEQVDFMINNPEVSVISAYIHEYDMQARNEKIKKVPLKYNDILKYAKLRSPLNHPVVMFKKNDVMSVGGYPDFRKGQDYALWSLMLKKGYKMANINKVLLKMRVGEELLKRRGYGQLKNEIKVINFQRHIGFISYAIYIRNILMRSLVRLAPIQIKKLLYKYR